MEEHTQTYSKEQLNTAQKRLNAALNVLEETIQKKAKEFSQLKETAEDQARQTEELQGYSFELEQRNATLSSKIHYSEERCAQIKAVSQEASQELAEAIQTLQTILQKQTLLEKLEV